MSTFPNLVIISLAIFLSKYPEIVSSPCSLAIFAMFLAGSTPNALIPLSLKGFRRIPSLLPMSKQMNFLTN